MKGNFEENVYALVEEVMQFQYQISSVDRIWDILFPDKKNKYHHIRIMKSYGTFYLFHIDGELCNLEIEQNKCVRAGSSFGFSSYDDGSEDPAKVWNHLITSAREWLKFTKRDWIKAAKAVYEAYPLNRRYGIVPSSLVKASLSDIYHIDKELGKAKTKKFIRLFEEGYFRDRDLTIREDMTVNDYFEYCKIAYIAGKRKEDHIDKSMTGRKMYECYADGRDEGLLEIDPNSKTEFADWIDGKHPKKDRGGHPWEIKRGGNTTHIDLSVSRPYYRDEGFTVCVVGASIGRLKEAICMFLGIHQAGLPITISDAEGVYKRLLARDNFGIVPCHDSLHRANQHFHEHEDVHDVLYFDDLGRYKRRIKPFIIWEPLPILRPVK
ncbi:hypothetical protein [Candidatus Neptunochlamydia vexilliferae]|nr:hypothetical protein [Candidatus Neptunochlamydia vexilliferae]